MRFVHRFLLASIFILINAGSVNAKENVVESCVLANKGNVYGAALCAAGQFTIEELDKCIHSSGENCFGPNNDLRAPLKIAHSG